MAPAFSTDTRSWCLTILNPTVWYLTFLISCDLIVSGRVPPWCSASDDPVNCTDDTADEIMERIVRSATQGPSQRTQPRERRRSRANRKSRESFQHFVIINQSETLRNTKRLFFLSAQWGGHWRMVWRLKRLMLSVCQVAQRCRCELDQDMTNLEALSLPLQCLHPTWRPAPLLLGTKIPTALLSPSHPYAFSLHGLKVWNKCFLIRVAKRWTFYSYTAKQCTAFKPLSFAIAGKTLMFCLITIILQILRTNTNVYF